MTGENGKSRWQIALLRMSAELAAILDERDICQRVVSGLCDTLGYDFVVLFLKNAHTHAVELAASAGLEEPLPALPAELCPSGSPLMDGRLRYMPDVSLEPCYAYGLGGSEVDIPIFIGGQVQGLLVAESEERDAFDQEDFDVLTAVAQQAGLAIEKARLVNAERRRADELDALRITLADVTAELELPTLLQAIVERAAGLLGASGGELGLYDNVEREIRVVVSFNLGEDYVGTLHKLGEGAMGRVAETCEPLIIDDYHTWEGGLPGYSQIHATLAVPLVIGSRLVGVFTTVATDPDRRFGPDDLRLLNLFGHQAAIAIENARLYEDAKSRVAQLTALQETTKAVASTLDLDTLLNLIIQQATALVQADGGIINLVGRSGLEDEAVAATGIAAAALGTRAPLEGSLSGWATLHNEPVISEQLQDDGRVDSRALATVEEGAKGKIASIAIAPLSTKDQVVGTLVVMRKEGGRGAFGGPDLDLLVAFANQAATAIENARLFEAQQRRAEQFRLISEVGRQMVTILDIDHLLAEIVRLVSEILGYYLVGIGLVEGDEVVIHTGVGPYFETSEREPLRLKLGEEGIVGRVASTGEPLLAPDVSREPRYYHVSEIPQTKSELAVPLRIKDRVMGVLDVQSRRLDAFDQSDVIVLQSLADQAAIAIENARLYDQAQREIADRKNLQEETRRQKDYFEALFVNSPVAVATAELDGTVVSWNPMAEKLFRYTQREAIGRNLDDLVATDDSIRTEARGCTHQVVTVGRVQLATQRTRKDGSLVDVELLALPILVAGEKVGFIAIYVDISDLQEARRQAEAASEAKGTFLASMSHELRTPLNAILGFTQLMDRDQNLTSEQQQNLRIINRSGEHLLALINDVLEMSKIEAGRQTLQVRGFDLHNLLEGLEEVFRNRAEEKGLTMTLDVVADVPRYVCMDEGKLRQILMNLIGNAVKFTEEGSVALRALVTSPDPSGAREGLVFEVEDTGPGIALEELGAVFEPFVQAAAGLRTQEGSGLGLTISQEFALLMGGEISVNSELRKGSIFRLGVPAVEAREAEARATLPSRRVLGVEPEQPVYRLLIVDDSEIARRLLVKLLEPQGFEVREASNGQEAIEVWDVWEPHLIWMDMRMPVLDGYETTRRIKRSSKGQDTVIVALTASAFDEDRETILATGCDDLVRKPFRRHEIFDVLAKHLDLRLLYEEETAQASASLSADRQEVLTPTALAALPAEWLADLRQATVRADLNLMLRVIDRFRERDLALADALAELAQGFEYSKILTLIEDAGGPE